MPAGATQASVSRRRRSYRKELRFLSVSADPVAAIDDKRGAINKPSRMRAQERNHVGDFLRFGDPAGCGVAVDYRSH